ncbi:HAMP domain-containing sensor histidine kinase [Kordia sp.]|uniref:sensor histidine kinase n=1 Tax=Kordia sp. TaxID=1965332 RepID=UPI0025C721EF|nr:HAMP domain-containing sensor histidine kinase [Kordia sp.]MCH2196408.1 HAMP domain-containing histidine kinase [Kordia sp.]
MSKKIYIQLSIRIVLIALNAILIYYFFQNGYVINGFGFTLLLIFQVFLCFEYIKKLFLDIEKTIDCLLNDDFSNKISTEKQQNSLHAKAAKLQEKYRTQNQQHTSEQVIFTNIIESLTIGVLILRKGKKGHIEVFQLNKAFVDFFQIPKFYNWNLLKDKITPLIKIIDVQPWKRVKHTISLTVNEQVESFFLKTSITHTNEFDYLMVTMETIQQLIDKKEKESWYKLMTVMSHEIINTITPISSLAENLDSLLQDEPDEDTLEELSQGLKIIKKRSSHLNNFVNTYRQLSELPLPDKKEINFTETVQQTLNLFSQEFKEKGIQLHFQYEENIQLLADKQQLEQVVINLISNCLYALNDASSPEITVHASSDNNRVHLIVSDNGIGISKKIKNNIFVPYFTTRKEGSGIGLTLTKSIVEAHDGTIFFKSENGVTTFTLSFQNT